MHTKVLRTSGWLSGRERCKQHGGCHGQPPAEAFQTNPPHNACGTHKLTINAKLWPARTLRLSFQQASSPGHMIGAVPCTRTCCNPGFGKRIAVDVAVKRVCELLRVHGFVLRARRFEVGLCLVGRAGVWNPRSNALVAVWLVGKTWPPRRTLADHGGRNDQRIDVVAACDHNVLDGNR
jgi:hypothetical protein